MSGLLPARKALLKAVRAAMQPKVFFVDKWSKWDYRRTLRPRICIFQNHADTHIIVCALLFALSCIAIIKKSRGGEGRHFLAVNHNY